MPELEQVWYDTREKCEVTVNWVGNLYAIVDYDTRKLLVPLKDFGMRFVMRHG